MRVSLSVAASSVASWGDSLVFEDLCDSTGHERYSTAYVLVLMAEVDVRKLYVPAGYPSMHAFCTERLNYSEDAALKRIQAARKSRDFPELIFALEDGRLHLTAICMLCPYLTPENADELIAAATYRRKWEIKEWLAKRFGQTDLLATPVAALPAAAVPEQHAPAHVEAAEPVTPVAAVPNAGAQAEHAPAHVGTGAPEVPEGAQGASAELFPPHAPAHVPDLPSWAPENDWTEMRIKVRKSKLKYARELMSHRVPSGSASLIYDRAIDLLIRQQEKRKFGAVLHPRTSHDGKLGGRRVPPQVRRVVWRRDGGRCSFVSADGKRCEAREFLEFDHIKPVARGGKAGQDNVRLRCRAHNQYEAEKIFGAEFMRKKRERKN